MKKIPSILWIAVIVILSLNRVAATINPHAGNFLLTSGNLILQINKTGDAVDGVFLPTTVVEINSVALDSTGGLLAVARNITWSGDVAFRTSVYNYKISTNGTIVSSNSPPLRDIDFKSTFTPNGDLLVGTYTSIYKLNATLDFLDAFPIPSIPAGFYSLLGIGVAPEGETYLSVYNSSANSYSIVVLDTLGNLTKSLGPYNFSIPALTIDTNNHIFCVTPSNPTNPSQSLSRIIELDNNGKELQSFLAPVKADSIASITIPSPPKISFDFANNELAMRWPVGSGNYQLQSARVSSPDIWTKADDNRATVAGFFVVTSRTDQTGMLFRLVKPL